jgi:hypothetical protein
MLTQESHAMTYVPLCLLWHFRTEERCHFICCSECDVRELLTVASSGNYCQYYIQCSVSMVEEKQLNGTELLLTENG